MWMNGLKTGVMVIGLITSTVMFLMLASFASIAIQNSHPTIIIVVLIALAIGESFALMAILFGKD